ncbi:hypothetical protein BDP27DRAFT_148497 [Rhodocollybia butyracea]|uniref:Uncharacterized protein n=1 Tax=Rhodocollybia butyracea TaxID=206335 RepID=A0A9P5Q5Z1_9AGAR|nr:hypothetical protein BDP27DRAFT_148497 [Rhodocollybia butyracea]
MVDNSRAELIEVQEQRSVLRTKIERLNEDLDAQTQAMKKVSEDFQEKLAKQDKVHAQSLSAEAKRAGVAELGLSELTGELGKQFGNLKLQLELAQATSSLNGRQEAEADVQIKQLHAEVARLREREGSLERRYREGDLVNFSDISSTVTSWLMDVFPKNESEKELVNSLIKFSQDLHEKEMVAKENELRRVCLILPYRLLLDITCYFLARQHKYYTSAKS